MSWPAVSTQSLYREILPKRRPERWRAERRVVSARVSQRLFALMTMLTLAELGLGSQSSLPPTSIP